MQWVSFNRIKCILSFLAITWELWEQRSCVYMKVSNLPASFTCHHLCVSHLHCAGGIFFPCLSLSAGVSNQRKVVFLERRHKEPIQELVEPRQADREEVGPAGGRGPSGAEAAAARLHAQRSLSPKGHRSSSLPPPAHRNVPSTPPLCTCASLTVPRCNKPHPFTASGSIWLAYCNALYTLRENQVSAPGWVCCCESSVSTLCDIAKSWWPDCFSFYFQKMKHIAL